MLKEQIERMMRRKKQHNLCALQSCEPNTDNGVTMQGLKCKPADAFKARHNTCMVEIESRVYPQHLSG